MAKKTKVKKFNKNPFKSEKIYSCWHPHVDDFIQKVYELNSFNCYYGSPNDSYHKFNIEKGKMEKWDLEDLQEILEEEGCEIHQLRVVLKDLCNKGIIPPGTYLINVSW